METKQFKSQKQIDNEIQEELKQLRKDNSQLLEQNRELLEWQNSAKLIIEQFISDTHHYEMNASLLLEAEEILTKHSKDV